ncbi:hypothetical protein BDW42DRAFT_196489 [Aspergillus taichungensis]|uniref:Uncharacterized protein n=1 Tax=Aspergillus taichungensis TaxID=482145 RepID=A0A2J5HK62_9EURO|nr:hypothetical protein BDW42DRAFT_196489 [Aspergillus taichungensis]
MAIFTGGRDTSINSPRHLTLRHAVRAVKLKLRDQGKLDPEEAKDLLPELNPGQEQLHSFWSPSLEAGRAHHIAVEQTVEAPGADAPLRLKGEQKFFVEAPQFSLPAGSIYSVHPPPGYSEEHRILPHVVLSDPHLPWERLGSPKAGEHETDRNRVPWLALLVFTQEELRLSTQQLNGPDSAFSSVTKTKRPIKQTASLSVRLALDDLSQISRDKIDTPVRVGETGPTKDEAADFVLVPADLFTSLFSPFDEKNQRQSVEQPDTSPYQYLSHVRQINAQGMAVAGIQDVGVFSVVVANRCGPLDNFKPATVCVHLVSIEGVEDHIRFPLKANRVALCSLYSWTYPVLPPNTLNVGDTFDALGSSLGLLRPPDDIISGVRKTTTETDKAMTERLAKRLEDGYSLVQYRTQTGERTVALFRGPCTPTTVPRRWKAPGDASSLDHGPRCSNSGLDLQILDKEIGLMDISYSVAWQVGRMLALADQAFTTALMRLRTAIHAETMRVCQTKIVQERSQGRFPTKADLLGRLNTLPDKLNQMSMADGDARSSPDFALGDALDRWHRPRLANEDIPNLSYDSDIIEKNYPPEAVKVAKKLAMGTNQRIYDETNDPVSTDWMVVLSWVMDRLFLHGIPAHYLITDPSHLDHERLHFFHIDANWTDALLDGALSLGNHLGRDRDRPAIKEAINQYLYDKPPLLEHPPQIPSYGFYLRSDVVSMYPDLKVTTLPDMGFPPVRAPLLRHEIVADGVMLGLFDRIPGSTDFQGLVFTQPPHQQRFAVADTLEADKIHVRMRPQYTVPEKDRPQTRPPLRMDDLPTKPDDPNNVFLWGTKPGSSDLRLLHLPRYATLQLEALNRLMGETEQKQKYFDDDTATSALFALQLNDPIFSLTIKFNPQTIPTMRRMATLSVDPTDIARAHHESLRGLNLRGPSTVNTAVSAFTMHSGDSRPQPPVVSAAERAVVRETADFTRHPDASPGLHAQYNAHLVPHAMSIPVVSATAAAPTPSPPPTPSSRGVAPPRVHTRMAMAASSGTPAGYPIYTCDVYSVTSDVVECEKDGPEQDLVFSIKVSNNNSQEYKIKSFNILIDLGLPDLEYPKLMTTYEGMGATMLSNLRFNVLPRFVEMDNGLIQKLQLTLLPRSEKKWTYITLVREMGFMLSLAKVNWFESDHKPVTLQRVTVPWEAYYEGKDQPQTGFIHVYIKNLPASGS